MAYDEYSVINRSGPGRLIVGVIAALIVIAGGVAYYLHTRNADMPHGVAAAPAVPPAAPAEPAIEHPVPADPLAGAKGPPPPLADSDGPLRDELAAAGSPALVRFLVPESLIRHLVVTVDNLPRQKVAFDKRPVVAAPGTFAVNGDELHATIDARNFARYRPMVDALRDLDMKQVASIYLRFYPLFQHVYQDLGYPNGYFNDRLIQVIDLLLATPSPRTPIELVRPNVMYTFADPALEALPAGQKVLIRMGPDNAAVVEAKLKELRALVAGAPRRP